MNINIKIFYTILLMLLNILLAPAQVINDSLEYSELRNNLLSKNGKIAVIHKYYKFDSKRDSVFIFNNGKLVLSKQTNSLYEEFKESLLTSYNTDKKEIEILDTKTLKQLIISNVNHVKIIPDKELIFYLDNNNTYKLIKIINNEAQEVWSSPKENINFISLSDNKEKLLFQYSNLEKGIELIDLSDFKRNINKDVSYPIKHVKWSKKHPVVFLFPTTISDNKYPYLTFYNYKTNNSNKQLLNSNIPYNALEAVSDNSFKIIQTIPLTNKPYNIKELELWSTKDRYLNNALENSNAERYSLNGHVLFDYKNKKVYQPSKLNNHESISLNQNTLIVFDSNQYLDYTYQWSSRPRDISLYDIKNDKITIIVKKQESPFNTTSLSPFGNYFVYIKKQKIYFYNIYKKRIENSLDLKPKEQSLRTWSSDERYFYFIANSNLTRYDTKNNSFKTLINANTVDSNYEIVNSSYKSIFNNNSELHYHSVQGDNNTLIIKKRNIKNNTQTLLILNNEHQNTIVKDTKEHISDIKYSKDFKTITYSLENFNKPKTIYIYENNKSKLILDNTMPKEYYQWKKQKTVYYKDKSDNNLKGILFYPKNFSPNKKYPMITYTYEIQNHLANKFSYPSYLNGNSFNLDIYLMQDYFVFYPDVMVTKQGPGLSALYCIEESIKTVLKEEKAINEDKLGLIGVSFGGYTTNFIITQTDMFKAAVSGAGLADIVNFYFSYNEQFSSPNIFQFENGAIFNTPTFKVDKELFLLNSPILFADQIKTPLLGFAGKQDRHVEWKLLQEFFIALLRYRKPHISLFYKNEGHSILKKENQKDITKRTMNWFDYFLKDKDEKETKWIKYYTTIEED
ncbi:alpha/beta hydrolase family protein [Myroides odoratimimus]|uniref:alpha/beta hydrolase family protein n=1 Tax=Myroides odoratimimus TaxID=76832 RepID=UPI002DB62A2A|nr:prolyl oligopeptidase family serine peptidase [Myroides odoratimimus]MEC4028746.1 prolyl oligopeptidase family serine peptidase [Myroides odoratimimus]